MTPCPPWLLPAGQRLLARAQAGRLPHALLLTGLSGVGKREFGQWLVQALLCRARTPQGACGDCPACHQLLTGSHSDFRQLQPEGASAIIKVDAVRELVNWLQLTAADGGYRIALLEGADTMNRSAANSLLKTLEEPGDQAILLLLADRPGALPATIRSRCQKVSLFVEDQQAAIAWLAAHIKTDPGQALSQQPGRPLMAVAVAQTEHQEEQGRLLKAWRDLFLHRASIGRIVESLADLPTLRCLQTFDHWSALAIRHNAGVPAGPDPALQELISQTGNRLTSEQWFTIHDRLQQLYRSDSPSFRTSTVLEGLFADIRLMISGRRQQHDN